MNSQDSLESVVRDLIAEFKKAKGNWASPWGLILERGCILLSSTPEQTREPSGELLPRYDELVRQWESPGSVYGIYEFMRDVRALISSSSSEDGAEGGE
jgi:hypothetical protein